MWPDDAQLILRKSTNLTTLVRGFGEEEANEEPDIIGRIFGNGKLGWLANGPYLEIVSQSSGEKIAVFDFDRSFESKDSYVSCVAEVLVPGIQSSILAVGLQLSPAGGKICLVSTHGSTIIGAIDLVDKVTSCCFIPKSPRTILQLFDGCLAVGTEQGKVILLDLCLKRSKQVLKGTLSSRENLKVAECHIVYANLDAGEISEHHQQSKKEGIYFGIQLEVLEGATLVTAVLAIPQSLTLVVGLDDGRMFLYDLEDLQVFHLAYPPESQSPLMYLTYVEPADDPRACIYVWAFHSSDSGAIGVMHSIMFERKFMDQVECIYKNFLSCSARLTMPFYDSGSVPISCHSITKVIDEEEELKLTLFSIVWATSGNSANLMIFDLNQWYKEQMPEVGDWRTFPSYTAAFPLGDLAPIDIFVDGSRVVPFNSIQRPEEHFYPNSLSFDVDILSARATTNAYWPGLQNKVLHNFTSSGSAAILEPSRFVSEMNAAALSPQFQDFYSSLIMSLDSKREFLLSIALEYNCTTFLKSVALAVADGSHIGSIPSEALGLSTVTDWLWARARALKDLSNNYCVPLFDYSGRTIDEGIRKTLTHCTRQMRVITEVLGFICSKCRQFIPNHVIDTLEEQLESVKLAADYQETVQWLLNVGLLPEGIWPQHSDGLGIDAQFLVPYPYQMIATFYRKQRKKLRDRVSESQSSKFIYIDNFIKEKCDAEAISSLWRENGETGLYPPSSLQQLLRILLLPDFELENKHVLFVYLFMDINHVLGNGRYGSVVQNLIKFPAVFQMDPAVIKSTQAFWYLDHGELETAVEELTSPMSQERHLEQWQRDFLVTTLLKQDMNSLALRALKTPGVPVEPSIEIDTLLVNDLVSEAFAFQRAKGDANLLIRFFEGALKIRKRELLLDLSLNEGEVKILLEFLEKSSIPLSENLHFVYLLQRSEFVDAVAMIDKLLQQSVTKPLNLNGPREILSLFHTTLDPTTRQLTYMGYSNPEKFRLKNFREVPKPLSSTLIQQRTDPSMGLYQRSVLGIREAGGREIFDEEQQNDASLPFLRPSELGFFSFSQKTQTNNVVNPVVVVPNQRKRQAETLGKEEEEVIKMNAYEGPLKRAKFNESDYPRKSFKSVDPRVFTRFSEAQKPVFNFTDGQEVRFEAHKTPEKRVSSRASTLLSTPVVKRIQSRDESEEDRNRFTPQSILKTGTSQCGRSTTPLSMFSRKSFESEDQKSIRFAIPGSQDTTLNSTLEASSSFNLDQSSSVQQKSTSAILEASEADDFYSPEASAKSQEEEEAEKMDLSYLPESPLPRPPLHSVCGALETTSSTPIGVKKSAQKDLSRRVLEANAKRSIISEIFGEAAKPLDKTLTGIPSGLMADILQKSPSKDETLSPILLEKSNILSDDSAANAEIIRRLADKTLNSTVTNITNDSVIRKFLESSGNILSSSGEYEDSRENLEESKEKAPEPSKAPESPKAPQPVISLDSDSDEDSRDDESSPSDSSSESQLDEEIEERREEDFDDFEEEEEEEERSSEVNVSRRSVESDYSDEYDEHEEDLNASSSTAGLEKSADVICLSSSDESGDEEDKHFEEIPSPNETVSPQSSDLAIVSETNVEEQPSDENILEQGLIMTHGESMFQSELEGQTVDPNDAYWSEVYQEDALETAEATPEAGLSELVYDNLAPSEAPAEFQQVYYEPETETAEAVSSLLYDTTDPLNEAIVQTPVQTEVVKIISNTKNTRLEIVKERSPTPEVMDVEPEVKTVAEEPEKEEHQELLEVKEAETNLPVAEAEVQEAAIEVHKTQVEVQEAQMEFQEAQIEAKEAEVEVQEAQDAVKNEVKQPSMEVEEAENVAKESETEDEEKLVIAEESPDDHEDLESPPFEIITPPTPQKPEETEQKKIQEEEILASVDIPVSEETKNKEAEKSEEPQKPDEGSFVEPEAPNKDHDETEDPLNQGAMLPEALEFSTDFEDTPRRENKRKIDSIIERLGPKSPQVEVLAEFVIPADEQENKPQENQLPKAPSRPVSEQPSTSSCSSVSTKPTPLRQLRSRAVSVDQKPISMLDSPSVKRSLRASSVPKSLEPPGKSRRFSTDSPQNEGTPSRPRSRRTSVTSESSTPNVLTRSAARRLSTDQASVDSRSNTPNVLTRTAARRLSLEQTPEPGTPTRRAPRRLSTTSKKGESEDAESEVSDQSSQSLQVPKTPSTSGRRRRTVSISNSDGTPPTPTKEELDYTSERRLTRRQRAVMEKMRPPVPLVQLSSETSGVSTVSADSLLEMSDAETEASVESNRSKRSTRSNKSGRSTRSVTTRSAAKKAETEEGLSQEPTRGSQRLARKRKVEPVVELEAIPEEKEEAADAKKTSGPVTRKRSKK